MTLQKAFSIGHIKEDDLCSISTMDLWRAWFTSPDNSITQMLLAELENQVELVRYLKDELDAMEAENNES